MKVRNFEQPGVGGRAECQAFTLVETVIASALFVMVIAALVSANLFGLRMNNIVLSRCGASMTARLGFDRLERDIRSAKLWQVGNATPTGNTASFTPIASGYQRGNAVQINLTTDTTKFILYYFNSSNTNNLELCRWHNTDAASTVIASNLTCTAFYPTNSMLFVAEHYDGTLASDNKTYLNLIHTLLEFKEFEYPMTPVGTNCYYIYYKLEFRLTPYAPD